jgi:Domain of unknown function (DUF4272)
MATATVRKRSLAKLKKAGFRVAPSLPTVREAAALRPLEEIATRLMALDALFTWVSQLQVADAKVKAYAKASGLAKAMTPKERALWKTARKVVNRTHAGNIGWRLENMWPLAWVLGFPKVPSTGGKMIDGATIGALFKWLPKTSEGVGDVLARAKPRTEAAVLAMEDLFYCAHNAARSAQLGGKTVPKGFHPVLNGGVVHERRHALTWATSPGVAWDDTDLST